MYEISTPQGREKPELFHDLNQQLRGLLEEERDLIANSANASALIYHTLPDLNWAGFYFLRDRELMVGPFQGKPACVRIAIGKGVCGTAAAKKETIIVEDVHAFPGHIACDSASHSEIVIPLIRNGRVLGVLDLDSPVRSRFDRQDQAGLEEFAAIFLERTLFPAF